ncbi:MAG: hypothetical protein PVI00_13955, partial [Desulfobacterales bacterium]
MRNSKPMNTDLRHSRFLKPGRRATIFGCCGLVAALLLVVARPVCVAVELADAPLLTKVNPPPTNLMILQDDSGSMTYEILVRGNYEGQFPNPDSSPTEGYCYVFDDTGDGYNYDN